MTALTTALTPPPLSPVPGIDPATLIQNVLKTRAPLTPTHLKALRATRPPRLPWLSQAMTRMPAVVEALRLEYQNHQLCSGLQAGLLRNYTDVGTFAEPLLRDALKATFGVDIDVRRTCLFNAAQVRVDDRFTAEGDPAVRVARALKAATRTLLSAALQNFQAHEAEPGGMDDGRHRARIYIDDGKDGPDRGPDLDIAPERFAALCRELDLGARYQRHLAETFDPAPKAGESALAARLNCQGVFKLHERSSLLLHLHLAVLNGSIDRVAYDDLLSSLSKNTPFRCQALTLDGVQLSGIIVIRVLEPSRSRWSRCALYVPEDPRQPLQVFDTAAQCQQALRDRLIDPAYRQFFLRFVPARERNRLALLLQQTFYPKVWNSGGWYEEQLAPDAHLPLRTEEIKQWLFSAVFARKWEVLKDDGAFHAVSTATRDRQTAEERRACFLDAAFDVLNAAAFVVPVLGEVMLGVAAAQLVYEVYEGFDSLARGEREQAWNYLLDVGENLALITAVGLAGAAASGGGEPPALVSAMRPVTLPDGRQRLWKPDLSPFAHSVTLPEGAPRGDDGLYRHQGRQWLALEGRLYSVKRRPSEGGHVLEHPSQLGGYEPAVRHNGKGGWLHELDTPQQWQGIDLFRRLGSLEASVPEAVATRALTIAGVTEAQLRQALMVGEGAPAILTDALQRQSLFGRLSAHGAVDVQAFEAGYQALQPALRVEGRVLQRQFPRLPGVVVEEILAAATAQEQAELAVVGRVPLRIAEEARLYQREMRLSRAYEGVYLALGAPVDAAVLMLQALLRLPEWSASLRVALREGDNSGRLLAQVGAANGPQVTLFQSAEGYRLRPSAMAGEFCETLLAALTDAGVNLRVANGAALRRRLTNVLPLRQEARQWLKMQVLKPQFRSPLRLANGRPGYPLSGRGGLLITEDALLDKLRLLELEEFYAEDALQRLYRSGLRRQAISDQLDVLLGEMQVMRQTLDAWAEETVAMSLSPLRQASRESIAESLWSCWRSGVLPALERSLQPLQLENVFLIDFPSRLPQFFRERVRSLLLESIGFDEWVTSSFEAASWITDAQWGTFIAQFPNVDLLEIQRGAWEPGLPRMVANHAPNLVELRLIDVPGYIAQNEMNAFGAMPRLRRLDLSGSRFSNLPISGLPAMNLDYLGLNDQGLSQWPQWLDSTALSRIGEVSLMENQLSELPPAVLSPAGEVTRQTRLYLQGNTLSRQTLFDVRLAEHLGQRFRFEFDIPVHIDRDIAARLAQRTRLQASLEQWVAADPSPGPSVERAGTGRRRVAAVLLDFWRDEQRVGQSALLHLDHLTADTMPLGLADFAYDRVQRLALATFDLAPGELSGFLAQFSQLRELSLIAGRQPLAAVPSGVSALPHLHELGLIRMGMTIDQAAMDSFARLESLASLQLDGNRLGEIHDMSAYNIRYLTYIGLADMQLTAFPDWLVPMIPDGIELINLDGNRITDLPDVLLNNRRQEGVTEISLANNPLPREILEQAHRSQGYNRPFSFHFDLPDDIAALPRDPHSSDSEEETGSTSVASGTDSTSEPLWDTGDTALDDRFLDVWTRLQSTGEARDLLALIGRLRYSADYRATGSRLELIERVSGVLQAAADDPALRQILDGMAHEPLQQLRNHETCPDGIRMEFNQMEIQVFVRESVRDVTPVDRGATLYRLMLRLFRSQALDNLARAQAGTRDEAEVRLAYRLHWARELDLPQPPRRMLYRAAADIGPGELDQALVRLRGEEHGEALLTFAAHCDFWVSYLREAFAERFAALQGAFEAAVLDDADRFVDETQAQGAARIRQLEAELKADERDLINKLTRDASLDRS